MKSEKESKKFVESEYFKCEQKLKEKTEETEKLKIEVKDLKQIINLEKELNNDQNGESSAEKVSKNEEMRNPPKSQSKRFMPRFDTKKSKDKEYNCKECYYQGTSEIELRKHIQYKHTEQRSRNYGAFNCTICGEQFIEK